MLREGSGGLESDPSQQEISVKISPVRRLCRVEDSKTEEEEQQREDGEVECVAACPQVLRQLCSQLRPPPRRGRGGRGSASLLTTLRNHLAGRPYWRRCLCSQDEVPTITERELLPLLSLTPAHRFVILVITNSSESLGSVVVGGESLIKAVYAAQNLPGLRPCLQSPSEPSLAFVRYDVAKSKGKRKEHKGALAKIFNSEHIKIGMVLIYQKTRMLYAGFPLASYGCMKQDFLSFISKYTKYDFHLKTPILPDHQLQPPQDNQPKNT